MLWLTIILISLRSLFANKLRSFLAILGIVIGVTAVIALLALGSGARSYLLNQVAGLKDVCFVFPAQGKRHGVEHGAGDNLSVGDAYQVSQLASVRACTPMVISNAEAKRFTRSTSCMIMGTPSTYFKTRGYTFLTGHGFTDTQDDDCAPVAVLASKTAKWLFGEQDPIDETIHVGRTQLRVIGVLAPKDDDLMGMNSDDRIVISLGLARQLYTRSSAVTQMLVQGFKDQDIEQLKKDISHKLRRLHNLEEDDDDDFSIYSANDDINKFSSFTAALTALLGGIGGIALLVGGIGIMNIMLVSVTERTREIGVRKAIGARDRDILRQFLIESVLLTSIGGVFGVGLGMLLLWIASFFLPFEPQVDLDSIAIALSFSASVGIFFGYYPARRAAHLDPIQALHYE